MLTDRRILVTGVTGAVAFPLAARLAESNEVHGLARFTDPAARARVEAAGVVPVVADLAQPSTLDGIEGEFDHVLHLAYFRGGMDDFDEAMRVNAEGTGALLARFRRARSALVMSSNVIYPPHDDPWYAHKESDPIGGMIPFWSPTSSTAKVAEEAVARSCAHLFDLPVVIARLNTPYGNTSDLMPIIHMDNIVAGRPVAARWDPHPHAPIHIDDIVGQLEAMLDVASVPASVVNWAGDDQVTIQQWAQLTAEMAGTTAQVIVNAVPGTTRNNLADVTRRRTITGPCTRRFEPAFRAIFAERHGPAPSGPAEPTQGA